MSMFPGKNCPKCGDDWCQYQGPPVSGACPHLTAPTPLTGLRGPAAREAMRERPPLFDRPADANCPCDRLHPIGPPLGSTSLSESQRETSAMTDTSNVPFIPEEMVQRALAASNVEWPKGVQYVLMRGATEMGSEMPRAAAEELMLIALRSALLGSSPEDQIVCTPDEAAFLRALDRAVGECTEGCTMQAQALMAYRGVEKRHDD